MDTSRTKKVVKNIFFDAISEIIVLVCGLVLPRLILYNYGSDYNGIVQSVSQFLKCIALMKLGIGGATKAALFKPLANKDDEAISEVLLSTEQFMRKISIIFLVFTFAFACIYPTFISKEFSWFFSFTLILVISISTFAENFFGFTYEMLLNADQRSYISQFIRIIIVILNTIMTIILVNNKCSIHIIQLSTAILYTASPVALYIYCHKKYNIIKNKNIKVNPLPQRWEAFAHEVASFVNDNTDIMVLTIFTNLLEVSVYTVYHYIITNVKKIIYTCTSSFGSAFGDMYARNEHKAMQKNLKIYELITFSTTTIVYAVTIVMAVPFILIYTRGVNDVNYNRYAFAVIITLAGAFNCFRYPYKQIINCTGNFKDTKKNSHNRSNY